MTFLKALWSKATTSEQISRNVESISTVSSESAKGVEEIACASAELNALTDDLQELVESFTVDKAAPNRTPSTNQPMVDQPMTNQPMVDQPMTNQPMVDQPMTNQPMVDQPMTNQPMTNRARPPMHEAMKLMSNAAGNAKPTAPA